MNGSLIGSSKISNIFLLIFLIFSEAKSRSESSFDTISKRISTIDTSYWKQTPIFKISAESNENSRFCFLINRNYFWNIQSVCLGKFEEYSIAKKSFVFLETPYKSSCSYYDSCQTVFKSSSHKHCIRQCFRNLCEFKMNCSCFILNDDKMIYEIISQSDETSYDICLKDEKYMLSFYDNYSKLCTDLCPIDCKDDEFIITNKYKSKKLDIDSKINNFSLKWDDSKPFIIYRETPVMTITHYFCYIGGLFGMWFGISANQLFGKLKENYFTHFETFIGFCRFSINIFNEIIIIM
jgi:hypothetical protein